MAALLDHTIVYVTDRDETIKFYTEVLGFEYGGSTGRFEVVKINDDLSFDLLADPEPESRHFAFSMDRSTFDEVFSNLHEGGFEYGDGPYAVSNMKGPGRSTGTHGVTHSVYFRDPSGHILEIISYD